MTPKAASQALYRRRQRDGRVCLMVECDEAATEDMLCRAGLLRADQEHSRETIAQALSTMIERLNEEPE
jgi:hypothetical protein